MRLLFHISAFVNSWIVSLIKNYIDICTYRFYYAIFGIYSRRNPLFDDLIWPFLFPCKLRKLWQIIFTKFFRADWSCIYSNITESFNWSLVQKFFCSTKNLAVQKFQRLFHILLSRLVVSRVSKNYMILQAPIRIRIDANQALVFSQTIAVCL